jgi:hypothetical protein
MDKTGSEDASELVRSLKNLSYLLTTFFFTDGSFDESSGLQMAKGFTKRRKMKPDAVHKNPMPPLKPCGAYLKRKRQEVFFVIKLIYF